MLAAYIILLKHDINLESVYNVHSRILICHIKFLQLSNLHQVCSMIFLQPTKLTSILPLKRSQQDFSCHIPNIKLFHRYRGLHVKMSYRVYKEFGTVLLSHTEYISIHHIQGLWHFISRKVS